MIKRMSSSVEKAAKLLIVDDSEPIRNVLSSMLTAQGFGVDAAANGNEALHLLNETDYDIVLTDINMPIMTGIELYHRIEHTCPKVANKVVFMVRILRTIRHIDFLQKLIDPFSQNRLLSIVY